MPPWAPPATILTTQTPAGTTQLWIDPFSNVPFTAKSAKPPVAHCAAIRIVDASVMSIASLAATVHWKVSPSFTLAAGTVSPTYVVFVAPGNGMPFFIQVAE